MKVLVASLALYTSLLGNGAYAQLGSDDALSAASAARPDRPDSVVQVGVSYGEIDEDKIFGLDLRLNLDREMWGLGLQLPLRFRVDDREPEDDEVLGILRGEDWDDARDFLRILRYAYVGQSDRRGPYYLRAGELRLLSLGHGTILHRYHNGMDVNRWRVGIALAAQVGMFGVEAMVGDVSEPYLTGVRGRFRPGGAEGGFEVGASLVADWDAPFVLPVLERNRAIAIMGLDVGYELRFSDAVRITPYVDGNKMTRVDGGWGVHAGVAVHAEGQIDEDRRFVGKFRGEYRRGSGDYIAPYFNTVYELERALRLVTSGGGGESKLGYVCVNPDCEGNLDARHGMALELQALYPGVFGVGAEYIAYTGGRPDGSLRLFVEIPAFELFEIRGFYYRINTTDLGDLFALDNRTALVTEVRVPFLYWFVGQAKWWRVWQAAEGGGFESVDDWSIGLGLRIAFGAKEEEAIEVEPVRAPRP